MAGKKSTRRSFFSEALTKLAGGWAVLAGTGAAAAGFAGCPMYGGPKYGGPIPDQLGTEHAGWQQANCGDCHTLADEHDGYHQSFAECGDCHGDNGQVQRPSGHADASCTGCHDGVNAPFDATAHADHLPGEPDSCKGCH